MAKKLTELQLDNNPSLSDIIYVVKDPDGTPQDRKVRFETFRALVSPSGRNVSTMTGDIILTDTDLDYQFLNPDGTDRTITLPAPSVNNHTFYIINTGTTFNNINIYSGAALIAIIGHGESRTIYSSENGWYVGQSKYRQLWVAGWRQLLTNGSGDSAQIEMTTNKTMLDYVPFPAGAVKGAYTNVALPLDYIGGTIYAKFYWKHPTTTVNFNVQWKLSGVTIGDNSTLDVAQGTGQSVTDTGGSANTLYISNLTPAITIAGTPTAGELLNLVTSRVGTSDTLGVEARLIGVMILYPTG